MGIIGIGVGSAIYHLQPSDISLVFDRLPIAVVLMTFIAILIEEEKGSGWGLTFLSYGIGFGIFSVIWWIYTESLGSGDLRLYIWIHLIAFLAAMVFSYFRSGKRRWLLITAALFLVASRVFEYYDLHIYEHFHSVIGGHPIKHLLSAAAVVCMIFYCRIRTRLQ